MSLEQALKKFVTSNRDGITHTKIGNPELNVFGNKYSISPENETTFYKAYMKYVLEEKQEAYLTEKQLECGKIAIDLDFRYKSSVKDKQHTEEHIDDFVEMLCNMIHDFFIETENKEFKIYICEKQHVNECGDKTKDGIHILINILCDFPTKMLLRDYMIEELPNIWDDLPITNTWSDVVDEGVMRGSVNWQLYGSKKPGFEPYQLKSIYKMKINTKGEIEQKKIDPCKEPFVFKNMCVRDTSNCHKWDISDKYKEQVETKRRSFRETKTSKSTLKRKVASSCDSLSNVKTVEDIVTLAETMLEDADVDYTQKEIHHYTMSLPIDFWGPGSYNKWIRVGWALKNSGPKLILTWLLFCSQSAEFDIMHNDALQYWEDFDVFNKEGLTYKSIIYWSKMYNFEEYSKIYKNTIDYYINYSFRNNTEFDLATTLFHMYKSQFVNVSIKDNIWYEFMNNKWFPIDSGSTLRLKISTEMYKEYSAKLFHFQSMNQAKQNNIQLSDKNDKNTVIESSDEFGDFKKKFNEMLATCKLLKKTNAKNNIMKEAKELYYDRDFLNKLDKDPYLLGCSNCIIDFRQRTHRKGKHDDFISKSTGVMYMPIEHYRKTLPTVISEIEGFMEQLFPDTQLRTYMWEHLASTLLGTNENQTFNIYTGSGANGKSKLVELMSLVLGEYKGTVPISLVTQKRNNIGGTSSEVYNLIGTRYAVMQEPSKGDKINEGIMKELTGGDPIQCRALFKDSVTFTPQFDLVVCTNTLFDIVSNDDGTWRRLRKVDFESKFTDNPFNDPRFPKKQYPHQFQVDSKIDEKFKVWAPILLSMLVSIAYRTQGKVKDVTPVISATQEYRKEQDIYLEFHNEYIDSKPSRNGGGLKIQDLNRKYRDWLRDCGHGEKENIKELRKYFERQYGKYPTKGWTQISYKEEIFLKENAEQFGDD